MKRDQIKLMEVCGTHTMAIARAGLRGLLPESVELISGPGCPVCVTSQSDIDRALEVAGEKDVVMTTFGDMMRVPGTKSSFEGARREGADVRVVYSSLEALDIARNNPRKKIVFMGIGFETTSPAVAATILEAKKEKINNFFVLSCFKLVFPALIALAQSKKIQIDGFICPGHVSVITGSRPYEKIARNFKIPCVITGFDEIDIIQGIKHLIKQIRENRYEAEIAYKRAVSPQGNEKARKILESVFEVCDASWRGLGLLKGSGLKLRGEFAEFCAQREFKVKLPRPVKARGCLCGEVLQGIKTPRDCKLFKNKCTPQSPVGPCMVSSEGTCAAYYKYRNRG